MSYAVNEIFYSLQGEGARSGRPSVFCRFAGCNLWSGLERDRSRAICTFCDTDFVGTSGNSGGKFADAEALAETIANYWHDSTQARPYVVFTGGEPALQLDQDLLAAVRARGFESAIETNGTLPLPEGIDWICVSPKPDSRLVQRAGNELKFIFPQSDLAPEAFVDLDFAHFFLQPMDVVDPTQAAHNRSTSIAYCLAHPQWQLSLQIHKLTGLR